MPPIRGLQGWLNSQDLIHDSQIGILKGSTIGIDANRFFQSQLPRDVWSEATGSLVPETIISMVNQQVDLFKKHEITPIFVFPGVSSTSRLSSALSSGEESSSSKKNSKKNAKKNAPIDVKEDFSWALNDKFSDIRVQAWQEFAAGRLFSSEKYFAQIDPSVSSLSRRIIVEQLQTRGCAVFCTPYRVPAQLSVMSLPPQKCVHACAGSMDLLLYGVNRVILEIDLVEGVVQWTQLSDILSANNITQQNLIEACLLAGYGSTQTFPSVYDDRKRFSFSRAVGLLAEHKSLQGVVDAYDFRSPVERVETARLINDTLDQLEGGRALISGQRTSPVRVRRSTRVAVLPVGAKPTAEKFIPSTLSPSPEKPTSSIPVPAHPIPSALVPLISTFAVSPTVINTILGGMLIDSPVALASTNLPALLDSLNSLRSQGLHALYLSLATGPTSTFSHATIATSEHAPFFASYGSPRFAMLNARWHDQEDGEWPRSLLPTAFTPFGKLLVEATPHLESYYENDEQFYGATEPSDIFAQSEKTSALLKKFFDVAGDLNSILLTQNPCLSSVLQALASSQQDSIKFDASSEARVVAACLMFVLYSLQIINAEASLTSTGELYASLLNSVVSPATSVTFSTLDGLFVISQLIKSKTFHDRRVFTRKSAKSSVSYGTDSDISEGGRVLIRAASVLPVRYLPDRDNFIPHPTAECVTLDATTASVNAAAVSDAFNLIYECALSAMFLYGITGISTIQVTKLAKMSPFKKLTIPSPVAGAVVERLLLTVSSSNVLVESPEAKSLVRDTLSSYSGLDVSSFLPELETIAKIVEGLVKVHDQRYIACEISTEAAAEALNLSRLFQASDM